MTPDCRRPTGHQGSLPVLSISRRNNASCTMVTTCNESRLVCLSPLSNNPVQSPWRLQQASCYGSIDLKNAAWSCTCSPTSFIHALQGRVRKGLLYIPVNAGKLQYWKNWSPTTSATSELIKYSYLAWCPTIWYLKVLGGLMEYILNCMSLFNNENKSRSEGQYERLHTWGPSPFQILI